MRLRSSVNWYIRNELLVHIKINEDPGLAVQEIAERFGSTKRVAHIYRRQLKKSVLKCNRAYRKSNLKNHPIEYRYASLA